MSDQLAWFKSSYSDTSGGNCLEVALSWHKSSYSDGEGGDCLEVALDWHKSSHSDSEGGNCLEVAPCPGTVHIRDSKSAATAPQLTVPATAWSRFVSYARTGGAARRR